MAGAAASHTPAAPAQTLLSPLAAGLFPLLDEAHVLSAGAATCDFHLSCHVFPARLSLFLLELNCHPPASSLQPPALLPPAVTPLWIPPSLTHQSFHQSLSRRHCESPKQHLLSRLPEPQTTAFKLMITIPSFNHLPVLVSAFGSSSPLRTLTQRTPP